MAELCYSCFQPHEGTGPCPRCGYDPARDAERHPFALRPGSILNGRYILGRVLGQGGFGITYVALDHPTGRRVAIKEYYPSDLAGRIPETGVVTPGSAGMRETFEMGRVFFLKEAQTLAKFCGYPHVVQIHSYFEENDTAYYTMEYLDGESLKARMARQKTPMTMAEAERLLLPAMEALQQVHEKGIIHRDVSPDNIFLTKDGDVKLIDFGAARYATGMQSKSLDLVLKHGFAPMEQYASRGRLGPWTDVYAIAATFYFLITGQTPPDAIERYSGDTLQPPSALGAQIRPDQERALLQALAVNPARRTGSMRELAEALEPPEAREPPEFLTAPEAHEPPDTPQSVPAAPAKKRSALPVIAAALVLAAGIAAAVFLLPGLQAGKAERGAYNQARALLESGDYAAARDAFLALGDYRDSAEQAAGAEQAMAYQAAAALLEKEDFAGAAAAFRALGDYRDSAEQAAAAEKEANYRAALEKLADGEYDEAETMLEALRGYKDVDAILDGERSPARLKAEAERLAPWRTVGNTFTLGVYEQDNLSSNGPEPIEWIVLDYDSETGVTTAVSRCLLEGMRFNDGSGWSENFSWQTGCPLRTWLNEDFYAAAFTPGEQAAILPCSTEKQRTVPADAKTKEENVDRVYLLSSDEVYRYFGYNEEGACEPTAYAAGKITASEEDMNQGFMSRYGENKTRCWWTRTMSTAQGAGNSRVYETMAISSGGSSLGMYQYLFCGVRPAIQFDAALLP